MYEDEPDELAGHFHGPFAESTSSTHPHHPHDESAYEPHGDPAQQRESAYAAANPAADPSLPVVQDVPRPDDQSGRPGVASTYPPAAQSSPPGSLHVDAGPPPLFGQAPTAPEVYDLMQRQFVAVNQQFERLEEQLNLVGTRSREMWEQRSAEAIALHREQVEAVSHDVQHLQREASNLKLVAQGAAEQAGRAVMDATNERQRREGDVVA